MGFSWLEHAPQPCLCLQDSSFCLLPFALLIYILIAAAIINALSIVLWAQVVLYRVSFIQVTFELKITNNMYF